MDKENISKPATFILDHKKLFFFGVLFRKYLLEGNWQCQTGFQYSTQCIERNDSKIPSLNKQLNAGVCCEKFRKLKKHYTLIV